MTEDVIRAVRWMSNNKNCDFKSSLCSGMQGSGCGSVGTAVASDTRDPQFKSRHLQNFIHQIIYQLFNLKEKKRLGKAHLSKNVMEYKDQGLILTYIRLDGSLHK